MSWIISHAISAVKSETPHYGGTSEVMKMIIAKDMGL